jgi:hypothetical protein
VELFIIPKIRLGMVSKRYKSNIPKIYPRPAKIKDTPPKVKATGKPNSKVIQTTKNKSKGNSSIIVKER